MLILTLLGMTFVAMAATTPPRIQVHGHRGARAVMPENTIPAFEYAVRAGVDVLELDVAVTKDNVLVVSHDPVLSTVFCSGPAAAPTRVIREMTLVELRRWDCGARANPAFPKQKAVPGTPVATLDEVLALGRLGRFEFNIETKITPAHPDYTPDPETFSRLLVDTIRRHKLEARCMIQSFDDRTLIAAARLAPEIRRSALFGEVAAGRDLVAAAQTAHASIVSPHYSLVTPAMVEQAHAAGLEVVPWTANTPEVWKDLAQAGVDGIITDDPAALMAHLRPKPKPAPKRRRRK